MVDFVVHWFERHGFGDEVEKEFGFVSGFHLTGWVGPWVSVHFGLEQWAQSLREKKKEIER